MRNRCSSEIECAPQELGHRDIDRNADSILKRNGGQLDSVEDSPIEPARAPDQFDRLAESCCQGAARE